MNGMGRAGASVPDTNLQYFDQEIKIPKEIVIAGIKENKYPKLKTKIK
jgi:hypothetical protein